MKFWSSIQLHVKVDMKDIILKTKNFHLFCAWFKEKSKHSRRNIQKQLKYEIRIAGLFKFQIIM
jgi:hypothetical protein